MFENMIYLLAAYLSGSIPFGLILSKIYGTGDLRSKGSGNIGATNMLRVGGKKLALLTLILDMLKAYLILYIISNLTNSQNILLMSAIFCIIGHIFPIWLGFKGGKGVATAIALYLYFDIRLFLCAITVWVIVFVITRISSLSSIMMIILLPLFSYFYLGKLQLFYMISFISILILFKHRSNIQNLINKTEKQIK